MRAASYVRVSLEQQARNTSIPNQLERAAEYARQRGLEVVQEFIEPGESGADLNRPALNACRAAARAGQFDVLVIYDLDRFNRNVRDLLNLRHEFQQLGISVWSICDNLELTSCDETTFLQVVILGTFGQFEREKIRRRMQQGRESSIKDGKFASGGSPPYGYRVKEGWLVINEAEASHVRMMFEWLIEHKLSTYKIAARLNALGMPTPQAARGKLGRHKQDGTQVLPERWTPATVAYILRNETYVGRWVYGKRSKKSDTITVACPVIIDEATFDKARARLEMNKRCPQQPKFQYLLRSLIRCECGAAFCGLTPQHRGKVYEHRYCCLARQDYRKHKRTDPCQSAIVPGPELENSVWSDIERFICQPHLLAEQLAQGQQIEPSTMAHEIEQVDRAILDKQREIENYLRLYGRGSIPVEHVDALVSETQSHVVTLAAYKRQLLDRQEYIHRQAQNMDSVVDMLYKLQDKLNAGLSFEDKRAVIEMLVKRIVIETRTDSAGNRYPVAHITYSFEPPSDEIPIPFELVFGVTALTNTAECVSQRCNNPFELEREIRL